jgi:hypothetical protein
MNEERDRPAAGTEAGSRLSDVAATIAGAAGPVLAAARRVIDERPGARVRRVRRMAHRPLANLWELHPEARRAALRELGLRTVPVELVAGTAVEGPPQRGGDFLPLRERRSRDWRARWQRILNALDRLVTLPPVELLKFGDEYWIVDGHNRMAAALYNGQAALDAAVTELRLPGMPAEPPQEIAAVLAGSQELRDAGEGRFTRTAVRPLDRLPARLPPPHEHSRRSSGERPAEPTDGDEQGDEA